MNTPNTPLPSFIRRLGDNPHANGRQTSSLAGCPDILELANGDFAIIGVDITDAAKNNMFPTAGCGPDERVVVIPRHTLIGAKSDIPDTV
jgi:hypothetical protein